MLQIIQRFLKYPFPLIALVVIMAYGQTCFMYFWNDDNAIIFKLQHLNEGMGNLGSGIFGFDSPYRMVIFSLIPVFYIFGMNPYAFFAYGLLIYFLAAITVFFFAKSFLKDNRLSLIASLIFASGLVGAETLWRVYNSVHTSITIIYILLFCTLYNYFISQRKLKVKILLYFVSLLFFVLAIQWGFVRAHGIIFIMIAQELLFNFNWKYSPLRVLPFFYLASIWYFVGSVNTKHIELLFSRIFENYEFELLLIPLKTLKNIFILDSLNFPLSLFTIFLIFLVLKFKSRILFFCLIFMVSSYLTYFVIYNDQSLNTTHRYLTTALPAFSLLVTEVLSRVFKSRKKLYLISGIYIVLSLIFANSIQLNILRNRSFPTKQFYQTLIKEIPDLRKKSIVFFDVKKQSESLSSFESFFGVGSMPNSTAIAIYYDLDRYDIFLPQTFDEMIKLIDKEKIDKNNIYTFFYSNELGLKNTTLIFKETIWGKNQTFSFKDPSNINYQFSSPQKVSLTIRPSINKNDQSIKNNINDLEIYLDYLDSKRHYYNLVTVRSDTHWQNYTIDKVFDQDYSTSWMASRGTWNDKNEEKLTMDLGEQRSIGGVRLKFASSDKTPTYYYYQCSMNNTDWSEAETVYFKPKEHAEHKLDVVHFNLCRYIKLTIEQTEGGDSPEIAEIEVIDKGFEKLDYKIAKEYEDALVSLLNSEKKEKIAEYLSKNDLKIEICFITDEFENLSEQAKSKFCDKKYAKLEQENNYEIVIPEGGTVLKKIEILPQPNVNFEISNLRISNILFDELINL